MSSDCREAARIEPVLEKDCDAGSSAGHPRLVAPARECLEFTIGVRTPVLTMTGTTVLDLRIRNTGRTPVFVPRLDFQNPFVTVRLLHEDGKRVYWSLFGLNGDVVISSRHFHLVCSGAVATHTWRLVINGGNEQFTGTELLPIVERPGRLSLQCTFHNDSVITGRGCSGMKTAVGRVESNIVALEIIGNPA